MERQNFYIEWEHAEEFRNHFGYDIEQATEADCLEFLDMQCVKADSAKYAKQFDCIEYECKPEAPFTPDWWKEPEQYDYFK